MSQYTFPSSNYTIYMVFATDLGDPINSYLVNNCPFKFVCTGTQQVSGQKSPHPQGGQSVEALNIGWEVQGFFWLGQDIMWSWILSISRIAKVRVSLISLWSQQSIRPSKEALVGIRLLASSREITRRYPFVVASSCRFLSPKQSTARPLVTA